MSSVAAICKQWSLNINRCLVDYQEPQENDSYEDYYDYDPNYKLDTLTEDEIINKLGKLDESLDTVVLENRVQKAVMQLIKKQLESDPKKNTQYIAETPMAWFNQLLLKARLKELANVRVVKKGRRSGMGYDITELVKSFYGKQILKNLNFNVSRKRVVNKEEYELIVETCAKIKLKLPEVIQATTTEKFFNPEAE